MTGIVITLMGKALQRELFERGVRAFPLFDCEAIMSAVLEKSAKAANSRPLSREEADEMTKRST